MGRLGSELIAEHNRMEIYNVTYALGLPPDNLLGEVAIESLQNAARAELEVDTVRRSETVMKR